MLTSPSSRVLTVGVLLAALFGLFVLAGADYPALHASDATAGGIASGLADDERAESSVLVAGPIDASSLEPIPGLLRGDPFDRQPWEVRYMYAVSILAALWVAVRAVDGWRINVRRFAVEPRERPLFARDRVRSIVTLPRHLGERTR